MITCIGMVKDEADIIGRTLEHLATQGVDRIVLLENGSIDGTAEILADLVGPLRRDGVGLLVIDDVDPAFEQARKMTQLAAVARREGARWVVPFDADELWSFGGLTLAEGFAEIDRLEYPRPQVAEADLTNYWHTPDDPGGHPFDAMRWHDVAPQALGKVAFTADRAAVLHMGNHGVDHPARSRTIHGSGLRIAHYPYRSPEQMITKARNGAAAIALTGYDRGTCQHWREYGEALERGGEDALRTWYAEAFVRDPATLAYDPPA